MIVVDDGIVIIENGMMFGDGKRIATEFRKVMDKPVKPIVLRHASGDHTGTAAAFIGDERPQIWAHEDFGSEARS